MGRELNIGGVVFLVFPRTHPTVVAIVDRSNAFPPGDVCGPGCQAIFRFF